MIHDPDYARVFTKARIIAWQHGYALALHGSFTRDLDLILIPWTEKANPVELFMPHLAVTCGLKVNGEPGVKPHGRVVYTLLFPEFGDPRWVDLSVMPRAAIAKSTGEPCTVCGKPETQHGTYPTCSGHPYTPDENCRHVIGARCLGAECNTKGCVRGAKAQHAASGEGK